MARFCCGLGPCRSPLMRIRTAALASVLLAAGCAPQRTTVAAPSPVWNARVTPGDLVRLRGWRTTFVDALAQARARGQGEAVDREGVLLVPDAALQGPPIGPGEYRCRVVKVGARAEAMPAFVAYPPFACRITAEGGVLRFVKMAGSQRPVGDILAGDRPRQVFLGTLMLGDEQRALEYGRDAQRDMVGAIEPIGADRWRLVLPQPRFESLLDVIELVPAA